jgi:hypothetical protein
MAVALLIACCLTCQDCISSSSRGIPWPANYKLAAGAPSSAGDQRKRDAVVTSNNPAIKKNPACLAKSLPAPHGWCAAATIQHVGCCYQMAASLLLLLDTGPSRIDHIKSDLTNCRQTPCMSHSCNWHAIGSPTPETHLKIASPAMTTTKQNLLDSHNTPSHH